MADLLDNGLINRRTEMKMFIAVLLYCKECTFVEIRHELELNFDELKGLPTNNADNKLRRLLKEMTYEYLIYQDNRISPYYGMRDAWYVKEGLVHDFREAGE